jgi:hypothetical protein
MITTSNLDIGSNDTTKIYRYVSRIVGNELSSVSNSCYRPNLVTYRNQFFSVMKYEKQQGREFKKQVSKKISGFGIFQDDFTICILMGLVHFGRENHKELAKLFYLLLTLKFYNSVVFKSFPRFCSDPLWDMALTKISATHLFRSRGGIANALIHVTNSLFDIYSPAILTKEMSEKDFLRITQDLRTRISQSMKSFAETYYKLQKSNSAGMGEAEDTEETQGSDLIADRISSSICTYNQIDVRVRDIAITKSGINRDIAETITEDISVVNHRDKIKFIIILLNRIYPLRKICKETTRNTLVRKIESGAKFGKYVVKDEILDLLYNTELGYRLKSIHTKQLVMFFSHYLTLYLQKKIC